MRILIVFAFSLVLSTAAWGAKSKPRAQSEPETYTAVDPNPMEASASAIIVPAPAQAPGLAPGERATPPSAGTVSTSDAGAQAPRWMKAPFDSVPSSQADAIAKRLKIVEELLRKYGRAYDYRALTLKDLEAIQDFLERESERAQ